MTGAGSRTIAAEAPLLLALALAPLAAGQLPVNLQDPTAASALVNALWICCLVWLSALLRVLLPGLPAPLAPRFRIVTLLLPALAAATLFTSSNRGATVVQVLLYAAAAGALWLAADSAARGGGARLCGALLAGGLLAGGLALQEYGLRWRAGEPGWRAFGTFTNPNFLAGYLVPCLLLALGMALRRPAAFRPAAWSLVLGMLVAVLAAALMVTGSRGGLAALGAGLLVLFPTALRAGELRAREGRLRLAAMFVLLLAVFAVGSGVVRGRQSGRASAPLPAGLCPDAGRTSSGESNRFRLLTWQGTARMGLARPILGWGAGAFETTFAPHAVADYTRHAHQNYLQLFAEQGAPGVLAWIALLGGAMAALWMKRPGAPDDGAARGAVGAAVAGGAAHGLLDSALFVPGVLLATWTLLGLALRPDPPPADEQAPAGKAPTRRGPVRGRAAAPRRQVRAWAAAGAAAGLLLTLSQVYGRSLLLQGAASIRENPQAAADALAQARAVLPWDHHVAAAEARLYGLYLGDPDRAVAAARRAIELAPERPPGYFDLGNYWRYQGDLRKAAIQYEVGLQHAPREVKLLYARASVLEQLGMPEDALEEYRKIAAVEESDAGQVRALGELRDYRFARARLALLRAAEARGDRDQAFRHRKAAACFLAERRRLFEGNPAAYLAVGDFHPRDPREERELRSEEERLWLRLAEEYRGRGENRLADLSAQEAGSIDASRERLERIIGEMREAGGL